MPGTLSNKVAVISGGSRGIGRGIAYRLAQEGCDCLLAARTEEDLGAVAQQIGQETGRTIEICPGDLRTLEGCQAVHAVAQERFGRVDILINNAGATQGGLFVEQEDDVWEDGFSLKFYAAVRLSRLLWPLLAESRGTVINIIGGYARTPDPDFMIGGAVNAALANFSKALAKLGLRHDVNVNVIHPGLTVTGRLQEIFAVQARLAERPVAEIQTSRIEGAGVRRLGRPEDVAALACFLCSPQARHIQGAAIAVDGGATAGVF